MILQNRIGGYEKSALLNYYINVMYGLMICILLSAYDRFFILQKIKNQDPVVNFL
jgi:hypothetical protein